MLNSIHCKPMGKLEQLYSRSTSLRLCVCSFLMVYITLLPSMTLAQGLIVVTVEGLQGKLYDNVIASLKIYKEREEKGLSDGEVRRMHNRAEEEIRKALEPFGYYSPIVKSSLEKDTDGWLVEYVVDSGEPVRVSSMQISIETFDRPPDELSDIIPLFPLNKGDVLDHTVYGRGKKIIMQQMFSLGYMKAKFVRNKILVDRAALTADIDLSIRSGPRFLFGKTVFVQELMDPALLQRFVNYQEGEPYSSKKLIDLQTALYKTNYFGKVDINGDVSQAEGNHIPITVNLTEPEFFNRYKFGLGYATDNGLRGKVGWDNRLFNKKGHTVSSEVKLSQGENSMKVIYAVPVRDPRFDKMLYLATYEDETWDDTDTRLFIGSAKYVHAGKKYKYSGGVQLRDERYQVGVTDGESFLPVAELSLSTIFADDPVNTRNGLFVSGEVRGASEDFFGDTTFIQGEISGKIIVSPLDSFRLIGRISLGATSVDSIDDLPPSLRFYAGGDQSVRGYGYKELGPEDSSGTVIGGKYLVFGSIEAEQVVTGNWSLAAFVDSGNAVNDLTTDLKEGVGIGVRYRLPFGQVRIDVASAISEDGNPLRLHLMVGGDL